MVLSAQPATKVIVGIFCQGTINPMCKLFIKGLCMCIHCSIVLDSTSGKMKGRDLAGEFFLPNMTSAADLWFVVLQHLGTPILVSAIRH